MSEFVSTLNFLLALGALLLQITTIILAVLYFTKKRDAIAAILKTWAIPLVFLVSFASMLMTLLYSEIFGFVPCGLCWLQRVALYPMVIISGIALVQKRKDIADYIIGLAIPGALVALYQHYLQMGGAEIINCPVAAGDCAKRILFEFGYMTFPLMSFSTFVFLIVIMLYLRRTVNRVASL